MVNPYVCWQKNPHIFRREREEYLRCIERKYGTIGLERYLCAEKEQKGCCTICKRKMILLGDHKPGTRKFRGLLCAWCNSILGNIERMPWVIDNVKTYLGAA